MRTFETSHFGLVERPKISWECHASLWNNFSSSPKSNFGLAKRPKVSSKCHASPWNIEFWLVKRKKMSSQSQATSSNIDFSTSRKWYLGCGILQGCLWIITTALQQLTIYFSESSCTCIQRWTSCRNIYAGYTNRGFTDFTGQSCLLFGPMCWCVVCDWAE